MLTRHDGSTTPIGHYAQVVRAGALLFLSGQVAAGATAAQQADAALANLGRLLTEAGGSPRSVLKLTVYLSSADDWAAVNAACARFFGEARPARSMVPVGRFAGETLLELDAIALAEGA